MNETRCFWFNLLIVFACGCDGCPNSKPFTPYTLEPTASESSPTASTIMPASTKDAGNDAEPAPFATVSGSLPPGHEKRWPLSDSASVDAPTGRAFGTGLVLDADADGARDLIAWAGAPDGLRGELIFASGAKPDAPHTLSALPGNLAVPGCIPRASLNQIGPATVAFDFAPQCGPRLRAKATRWLAILRLQQTAKAAPELVIELRLRHPPADENLNLQLDARDRDGDGRDDIAFSFALSGALIPFVAQDVAEQSVNLVFFDRPAGLSRDPSQPGDAMRGMATALLADARDKSKAIAVRFAAHRLRRLHALLCEEGDGDPVLATSAGPLHCGTSKLADSITYAEAIAASTSGDTVAALAAIDLASPSGSRSKDATRLVTKLAPKTTANEVYRSQAVPQKKNGFGSLAFDTTGNLLVRTESGVVQINGSTFAEESIEAKPWTSAVMASGQELVGIERRCDTPTLIALVRSSPDAVGPMDVPVPLLREQIRTLAPKQGAGACTVTAKIPFAPLGGSSQSVDFAIGSTLLHLDLKLAAPTVSFSALPLADAYMQGAFRSPDGETIAVHTQDGLLVASTKTTRLWTGAEIEKATGCVPSNGGTRVACVVDTNAVIYGQQSTGESGK